MSLTEERAADRLSQRAKETRPFLSIIIPAYNEERRLPGTLEQIARYLSHQQYTSEIIVVENGSRDCTAAVVECYMSQYPNIYLVSSPVRGKGWAVQLGIRQSRGQYCFLCDADLSMPIDELCKFLPPTLTDCDIAIGSREVEGARRIGEPAHRHVMGRIFARLVGLVGLHEYQDTQCGFKIFRREVVESLFNYQTLTGWGFDAELLYIAHKRGYRVAEVPIRWYYNGDSRVQPVRDSVEMLRDLLRVRWNDWKGRYDLRYEEA